MSWRNLVFTLALSSAVASVSLLAAGDLALTPERGVLLLTNGQLIEGTISAAGDRYDVVQRDGEIRVKRSQVALVARDARACYQHKLAEIDPNRVLDRLDLAEWCLRNAMLVEAETELAAARVADGTHPKIPLVEARLRLAREAPKHNEVAATPVKKLGAEVLDTVVRNLPPGAVESYTNHIQPLLLNTCTRSGCHGAQSTATMRLERIAPNRYTGRKSTQRNLQAVLAMVDRENPDQSKLLTVPIRPHSPARLTIFTDRDQAQYRQLVEWVYYLSRGKHAAPDAAPPASDSPGSDLPEDNPAESPSLAGRSSVLMERGPKDTAVKHAPGGTEAKTNRDWSEIFPDQRGTFAKPDEAKNDSGEVKPAGAVEPLPVNPAAAPDTTLKGANWPERATEQVRKKPPLPAALDGFVPKDAFDPELFNRRYLSK